MKIKRKAPSSRAEFKTAKSTTEAALAKILALIKNNPGIRPSEINRRLNLKQSDALRAKLIGQGLVRKVKEGAVVRLYAK